MIQDTWNITPYHIPTTLTQPKVYSLMHAGVYVCRGGAYMVWCMQGCMYAGVVHTWSGACRGVCMQGWCIHGLVHAWLAVTSCIRL